MLFANRLGQIFYGLSCGGTMAADQEQFFRILSSLLSTDNNVRSQAEVSKSIVLIIYILHIIHLLNGS